MIQNAEQRRSSVQDSGGEGRGTKRVEIPKTEAKTNTKPWRPASGAFVKGPRVRSPVSAEGKRDTSRSHLWRGPCGPGAFASEEATAGSAAPRRGSLRKTEQWAAQSHPAQRLWETERCGFPENPYAGPEHTLFSVASGTRSPPPPGQTFHTDPVGFLGHPP